MKKDIKMLKQIATGIAIICLLLAATAASAAESAVGNDGASVLDISPMPAENTLGQRLKIILY